MVMPNSPAIMSMAPDSRLASMAAVFSMTRMTMRSKCGGSPYQVGLGVSTTKAPLSTCSTRYGPK